MRTLCLLLIATFLSACGASAPSRRAEVIPPADRPAPSAEQGQLFARSANALGLDLWARMQSVPGNQIFSPASIAVALDMTYAGARGETAEQMARVLHVDAAENEAFHEAAGNVLASWNDPDRDAYTLAVANRLFGEQTFRFEQPFLDMTASTYGAPFEPMNFRTGFEPSRVAINDWVAVQTRDRIRDLIPPNAITPDTRLVLTNAVYFLADWESGFESQATYPQAFHVSPANVVQAPMMHQSANFRYAEVPGAQILEMPYRGREVAMTVILPRGDLGTLERSLNEEQLAQWIAALGEQRVDVALPKFRIAPADSTALGGHLRAMGMPLAFDDVRADLTGIGVPPNPSHVLYISEVFHKAFVEVDEEGTEAAAATAVIVAETASVSIEPEAVAFTADRPFLFLIRDTRSGAILFMGRLVDPS
jgi:serpin B